MSAANPANPLVQIERFLDELEARAATAASRREFCPDFVRGLVTVCGAAGGQLWRTADSFPQLEVETSADESHRVWSESHGQETRPAVDRVLSGEDRLILFPGREETESHLRNGSPFAWLIAAIRTPTQTAAVLVVMVEPSADPVLLRRLTELIGSACELASGFFTRQQLRDLTSDRTFQDGLIQAAVRFHAADSVEAMSLEIVTAARELTHCDRALLLVRSGRRLTLRASSGVESVSPRSDLANLLARLAKVVTRNCQAWSWDAGGPSGDQGEADALRVEWVDAAHSRALRLIPLFVPEEGAVPGTDNQRPVATGRPVGVLVFEWFQAAGPDWSAGRGEAIAVHAAAALRNGLDWDRAPLAKRLRGWRRTLSPRSLTRGSLVLGGLAILAAALLFIRAELRIEAPGELLPVKRTSIFAPRDGTVRELFVDTGSDVRPGDRLLTLDNEQLDLDAQRVEGEIQTALKQRLAIETSRLENRPSDRDGPQRASRLTAELEEVEEQLRSLEKQRKLLDEQQRALELVATSGGRVLTWNARTLLDHRPVRRGQKLLTVADLSGPWELRLAIPDHRSGHVQRALAGQHPELPVDFTLASEPGISRRAMLVSVGTSAEVREVGERPSVEGVVPIGAGTVAEPRPGVSVVARIHCGRYPLWYVWFHELWDLVYRVVWF